MTGAHRGKEAGLEPWQDVTADTSGPFEESVSQKRRQQRKLRRRFFLAFIEKLKLNPSWRMVLYDS